MAVWKVLTRGYSRVFAPVQSSELTTELLADNAFKVDLLPYQVFYANPQAIQRFGLGVLAEVSGTALEVTFARTEGKGNVVLVGTGKIKVVQVTEDFYCRSEKFVCATSQLKVLDDGEGFCRVTGTGSLFFSADEVIEVEENEKIFVKEEALVGFGKIEKELVKVGGMKFWNITGPGRCAILWSPDVKQKEGGGMKVKESLGVKEFKDTEKNEEDETILGTIFGKNDIIT